MNNYSPNFLNGMTLKEVIYQALLEGHKALSNCIAHGLTSIERRGDFGDYSHQFDILTERAIIGSLKKSLGDVYIVSEEAGEIPCSNPRFYALVDPVDGSNNVAYGLPFNASAIMISKGVHLSDAVAAGVIDHSTGRIYLGDLETGVTVDGEKPKIKKNSTLSKALVFVDLASLKKDSEDSTNPTEWTIRLARKARHVRFFAAASLEIAYILDGRADAYVCLSKDLKLMDFAAPITLLKWIGGAYLIIGGEENPSIYDRGRYGVIAATSESLLQEILSLKC